MSFFDKFKKKPKYYEGLVFMCNHGSVDYVCHKNNGDFEVFCKNCSEKADFNCIRLTSFDAVKFTNPFFVNLEKGKYLKKDYDGWHQYDIVDNEYTHWVNDMEEKLVQANIQLNHELKCNLTGVPIKR